MKIERTAAVALFVALGLKNAGKWNPARMASKLGKIKEMVDDDVKLEGEENEILQAVLTAAAAGEEFEIEGVETPAAEPDKTDEEKAAEKAAAKAAKDAEKAAAKAKRDAEKAAAKEPKITRPGICGEVLRDRGLSLTKDVKIDEALALTVDELYGKTNTNESLFALRIAKNAILGYLASAPAAPAE